MQLYGVLTCMENLIEFRKGLWWPKKDLYRSVVEKESANIETIMQYVNDSTFVIQAGGHMGIWPLRYSKIFKNVFTFESDTLNYYCLKKNIDSENVKVYPYAVGDINRFITMEVLMEHNRGANRVVIDGKIPMVTIDEMRFEGCNLLQLDIEGFEHQAINGAIHTINKFKPVIVLELKGHGVHYGFTNTETINLVLSLGYKLETTVGRDHIFLPSTT